MDFVFELTEEGGGLKHTFSFNSARRHDLSIAVAPLSAPLAQVSAFGLPPSRAAPFSAGDFVASVDAGGSVNCAVLSSLCPHSNGTHTECAGHALPGAVTLAHVAPLLSMLPALVLSVAPAPLGEDGAREYAPGRASDAVVSGALLEAAFERLALARAAAAGGGGGADSARRLLRCFLRRGALVVRTLPNSHAKRSAQYGGSNPPYFTGCAMRWALERGCEHVVMDLPSADREDDRGQLIAHRTWWGLPPAGDAGADAAAPLCSRTITEIAFVDDSLEDGGYVLDLQVAPFDMDAAPSRPLLYVLNER
jgi:hypothetical protein